MEHLDSGGWFVDRWIRIGSLRSQRVRREARKFRDARLRRRAARQGRDGLCRVGMYVNNEFQPYLCDTGSNFYQPKAES